LKTVAIIGGGLAGLISGIELSKKGVPCTLFEKKKFPFHRVCGEYISNEALPYLKSQGLYPERFKPSQITKFVLSSVRGQTATLPLDLGGFAISRFTFDNFLYERAKESGVTVFEDCEVTGVHNEGDLFRIENSTGIDRQADVVIGAFGKRSRLDAHLGRAFLRKRSPYVGVKYHAFTTHSENIIALHNFNGGYCGVVNIEAGMTNICYLVQREVLQKHKNISQMEAHVLRRNPVLNTLFAGARFVSASPQVINEISFATKSPVEKHILMAGDSSGMIAPLCGNGMAMAIHAAKLLSGLVFEFCSSRINRAQMEQQYSLLWHSEFANRLRAGRTFQNLFGSGSMSSLAVGIMRHVKPIASVIMRNTHGPIF
jgi:menaquinone-9 beta-reductase